MRSRWMLVLLPALILLFAACGDDDDGPTGGDATAPSAVTDLAAIAAGDSSITLTWTTPDDPSKTSSVSRYDLRYSLSAITDANWGAADTLAGEPVPGAPGVAETLAVAGLDLGTAYHFALRSEDGAGNLSALSNAITAATDSIDDRLIAYYPLVENGDDVTGHHDPIVLENTPFQEGGIYCNGNYVQPDRCGAEADVDSIDLESFTISARFKAAEAGAHSHPVFVGGHSWRWIGIRLETDSTVTLMYNNGTHETSPTRYTPGTWHEGRITYDGATGRLYLDGAFVCEEDFTLVYEEDDRSVGVSNFSNGTVFHGVFGRLKVYDGVVAP